MLDLLGNPKDQFFHITDQFISRWDHDQPMYLLSLVYLRDNVKINATFREPRGLVVECRTPNREVLGSIPTGVSVLCP